ncbi:MAG: hypothetical protein M3Q29_06535 [Chloroflexota bacterium]|nr:hypothetical protein [Chloroflexota bacterium]
MVGLRQAQIAAAVNRKQPYVAKYMGLTELPEDVQDRIRRSELSVVHGVVLAKYKAFPKVASRLASLAVESGWTSQQLEKGVESASYTLAREGLIKSFYDYDVQFDMEVCKACPFGAFRGTYPRYCLKPEHWQELQPAAIHERQEQLRAMAQARAEGSAQPGSESGEVAATPEEPAPGFPILSQMHYSSYKSLREWSPPAGCTGSCPCRGAALDYGNSEVAICTDPRRFEKLKAAETRAMNKANRAIVKAKRDALFSRIDALNSLEAHGLGVLIDAAMDSYNLSTVLKEAGGRMAPSMGVERPSYMDGAKLYVQMERVGRLTSFKIALEALLRKELHDAHEAGTTRTPYYDWVLGAGDEPGAASEAEEPEDEDGDDAWMSEAAAEAYGGQGG